MCYTLTCNTIWYSRTRACSTRRIPFTYGDLVSDEAFTDRDDRADPARERPAERPERRADRSSPLRQVLPRQGRAPPGDRRGHAGRRGRPDDHADEGAVRGEARQVDPRRRCLVAHESQEALRFFSTLRVVPTVTVDLNSSVRFSFSASRGSSDIDATIERLLELPAELAADRNRQLVVFFDEFQEVTSLDPRLPALMRSIFQTQRSVAHLYAGSKREMMHSLFSDKNEPFFRSAKIMEIGSIPAPLFADYIRAQFDRTNRGVNDEAVQRLLGVTDGHPYATQELAFALWDLVPEGFTATVDGLRRGARGGPALRERPLHARLGERDAASAPAPAGARGRARPAVQQRLPPRARAAAGVGSAAGAQAARRERARAQDARGPLRARGTVPRASGCSATRADCRRRRKRRTRTTGTASRRAPHGAW